MENSEQTQNIAKWNWRDCIFDLKRESSKKIEYTNLGPQASFFIDEKPLQVNLEIKMDKELTFSNEHGWVWHKSWNLPFIKVSLDFYDPEKDENYNPPENIFLEIIAVKPNFENIRQFHLIDIGISGNNRIKLNSSECIFSSLKFQTTSYNHKESKFHLVLSVCQKEGNKPNIYLKSLISPPIFVDSRKSARDSFDLKAKYLKSFIDIFPIESLEKKYAKKECKDGVSIENLIENNILGLFNYLTAPNIREKVKNPLFLAIYFNSCFELLINQNIFGKKKPEFILKSYQTMLFDYFLQKKKKDYTQKPFIFKISFQNYSENIYQLKKILEVFEIFQGSPISVVMEIDGISDNYKLFQSDEILSYYKIIYSNLPNFTSVFKKDTVEIKDLSENEEETKTEQFANQKKIKREEERAESEKKLLNNSENLRSEIQIFPFNEKKANESEIFNIPHYKEENFVEPILKEEIKSNEINMNFPPQPTPPSSFNHFPYQMLNCMRPTMPPNLFKEQLLINQLNYLSYQQRININNPWWLQMAANQNQNLNPFILRRPF